MEFSEIQVQIENLKKQLATHTAEIESIKEHLKNVEKVAQKTKHDQIADKVLTALRREGM